MAASGYPADNLAPIGLRPWRELASRLGIGRYGRRLKEQLLLAIESGTSAAGAGADGETPASQAVNPPSSPAGTSPAGTAPATGLGAPENQLPPAPREEGGTWVVFLPRDPQWALIRWEIGPADRQAALAGGGPPLALRLADVTGREGGAPHPHALLEVVVDAGSQEWYLPVPLSGRDYRVELGFRKVGGGWISLAFSAAARMPASGPSEELVPVDPFMPFSLDAVPASIPSVEPAAGAPQGLHERLYQQASGAQRPLGRGSESFQDHSASSHLAAGGQHSGGGLWASGRHQSGVGLAGRQRSFWLVADAELIVYGATDPAATLRIGEESVPLTEDGTFRVQVPFRDGEQLYPISAVAADGVQRRSISLAFRRTTPEANVNSRDSAVTEWF